MPDLHQNAVEVRKLKSDLDDLSKTSRKLFFEREEAVQANGILKGHIMKLIKQLERTKHVVITSDWKKELEDEIKAAKEAI